MTIIDRYNNELTHDKCLWPFKVPRRAAKTCAAWQALVVVIHKKNVEIYETMMLDVATMREGCASTSRERHARRR